MHTKKLLLCFSALAVLGGCARMSATTSLHADGSFERKVAYTIASAKGMGGQNGPKSISEVFRIPTEGSGVSVKKETTSEGEVTTVSRTIAAGAPALEDIAMLGAAGKVRVTCSVQVKKIEGGKLVYTETLHATAPAKEQQEMDSSLPLETVQQALPPDRRDTETARKLRKEIFLSFVHCMLGPPETNLFSLVANQDEAKHKMSALLFAALKRSFRSVPGLNDAQVTSGVRVITAKLNAMDWAQKNSDQIQQGGQSSGSKDQSIFLPMTFEVSYPGNIVETNGLLDPISNTVYWSLYPESVELGDITLRLVVQP